MITEHKEIFFNEFIVRYEKENFFNLDEIDYQEDFWSLFRDFNTITTKKIIVLANFFFYRFV